MNVNSEQNNKVYLCGTIVSKAEFSHEVFGEGFYEFFVRVNRLSGQADTLPVTISERLMTPEMQVGQTLCALGQFRSYNKLEGGRSRLMLTVFVREVLSQAPSANPNSVVLSGYICKPPVYRTTPFNREIADLLIAVNRSYNKSDYIPAIAWGRNARFVSKMEVGDRVVLSGRIQSREYQKKQADESFVTMTAYEVSISKLALYDEFSPFDIDEEFALFTRPHAEHSHADKL
ncbi:MAG TPA: single-stranded DNA-binding protein [Candidatus Coproplasma avicola]|uniref:Single-stranded DNA-binding protein n=1 Tax=Candidatus Coproplasma avicola TaxID=2840744 RepID=A0A9D1JA57_9FIRM|nr:single-stranded DNA-binding protein [Candidatus Coproplasma avicola]